jgi:putative membrane protein insertion efficiency factor
MSRTGMMGLMGKTSRTLPRRIAVRLLGLYKLAISPLLPPACRFYPTCSEYCREAVVRFGLLRGGWLGLRRLLRCQPLCRGGLDPVPEDWW